MLRKKRGSDSKELLRSPPATADPVWAAYRASPTPLSGARAGTPAAQSSSLEVSGLDVQQRLSMDGDEWLDVYARIVVAEQWLAWGIRRACGREIHLQGSDTFGPAD